MAEPPFGRGRRDVGPYRNGHARASLRDSRARDAKGVKPFTERYRKCNEREGNGLKTLIVR